jgi:hypothetical protein
MFLMLITAANKRLDRPGMKASRPSEPARAGRSAPIR